MLDFEKELKKFHPSLEVDGVEDAIYNHDMADLTDLILELEKERKHMRDGQEEQ